VVFTALKRVTLEGSVDFVNHIFVTREDERKLSRIWRSKTGCHCNAVGSITAVPKHNPLSGATAGWASGERKKNSPFLAESAPYKGREYLLSAFEKILSQPTELPVAHRRRANAGVRKKPGTRSAAHHRGESASP